MSSALDVILRPASIAVIGASRSPRTIGHQIVANLLAHGFTGPVYPVNPAARSIHSVRAYPDIGAVPDPVDLAVIVVPKEEVIAVADACGRRGVKAVVVISAGFREIGGEGVEREQQLTATVRRYGMRMVGPNCLGVLNADPAVSLNATFAPVMPPPGPFAFVAQSGALGLSVLDYASEFGIGICQFVSVGNKPDVSGNDLLLHWEEDPAVGVILMYVENFGNPRRFLEIASRITKRKPIIAVKSGRSRAGARAAASHTGSLAASDTAVDALLAQAGVLRAGSVEELFDLAMAFSGPPLPRGRRVAVITNSGGPGILAVDALEANGLELVDLSPATVERLRSMLPDEASLRNPLDVIASASAATYGTALNLVLQDQAVDAALAIFVPPLGVRQEDVGVAIAKAWAARADRPVLAVLMGREGLPEGRAELREAAIPAYIFPESAARALGAMCRHRDWRERPSPGLETFPVDRARAGRLIAAARDAGRTKLTELEALELLAAYGIPAAGAELASEASEAARIAERIGFPVVLKIVSPDLLHKTDVGGVRAGLHDGAQVRAGYQEILQRVAAAKPDARISGILVQRQAAGRELIVGVLRDPSFGPLVMFGLGGILVEVLQDVVFRIAPITRLDARDMLRSIRGHRLLDGVRGDRPLDQAALEEILLRVSQLAIDFPQLAEVDINPLLASPERVLAVDARVLLSGE